ncbi:hypothetical protein KAW50_08365, partial [candidate division WOR-3 bacterium]|nr:hypothetical protein [candidate division WOR-3 bacterium]
MADEKKVEEKVEEIEEVTPEPGEEKKEEEVEVKPPYEEDTGEPKPEEEAGEQGKPKEPKEEESYEKRYKDLQSHTDKKITRYERLLEPYKKNIKEDEQTGDLSFQFNDTPTPTEKKEE